MTNCTTLVNSFKRNNLRLYVTPCPDHFTKQYLLHYLLKKHTNESGIIYTSTKETAQNVVSAIKKVDFAQEQEIAYYHGGLTASQRSKVQEDFLSDKLKIIASTNAFGMGVDKPNIRFVIHFQIPGNLENYYQEVGRAGRDGKPAACYLLYNQQDIAIQKSMLLTAHPDKKSPTFLNNLAKLKMMLSYAGSQNCRNNQILTYFDENPEKNHCQNCDQCLNVNLLESSIEYDSLEQFAQFRERLAARKGCSPKAFLSDQSMLFLLLLKPSTKDDFRQIPGLGSGWVDNNYQEVSMFLNASCFE